MTPDIHLTDTPDSAAREAILGGLLSFNAARAGPHEFRPLAVLVGDPATGDVIGGLWGKTSFAWLFVELLFVPEALRGSGLGASLLRRAEEEAVRRGCRRAWLLRTARLCRFRHHRGRPARAPPPLHVQDVLTGRVTPRPASPGLRRDRSALRRGRAYASCEA